MSEALCGYQGDREATLMAYLYDDIAPSDRAAFEAHLVACGHCRLELEAFGAVRQQLSHWSPAGFASIAARSRQPQGSSRRWWAEIPAWAQVAAAMLVLGVSAGLANLDVHYDRNGLNIRTGWSKAAAAPAPAAQGTPWRSDLAALEQQLRSELRALPADPSRAAAANAHAAPGAPSDAEVLRRVRGLIDESERRQERELALRVASVMRDFNSQREADLRRIDQNLDVMSNRTGVEVMRNRQMVDFLMQRVSQRQ